MDAPGHTNGTNGPPEGLPAAIAELFSDVNQSLHSATRHIVDVDSQQRETLQKVEDCFAEADRRFNLQLNSVDTRMQAVVDRLREETEKRARLQDVVQNAVAGLSAELAAIKTAQHNSARRWRTVRLVSFLAIFLGAAAAAGIWAFPDVLGKAIAASSYFRA